MTDIEKLIAGCEFPNTDHKRRLRERLFGETRELELDELAAVAGGSTHQENAADDPENSEWMDWLSSEEKPE